MSSVYTVVHIRVLTVLTIVHIRVLTVLTVVYPGVRDIYRGIPRVRDTHRCTYPGVNNPPLYISGCE